MHRRTSSDFMGRAAANFRACPNHPLDSLTLSHASIAHSPWASPSYTTRQRNVVAARAYRAKYNETYE